MRSLNEYFLRLAISDISDTDRLSETIAVPDGGMVSKVYSCLQAKITVADCNLYAYRSKTAITAVADATGGGAADYSDFSVANHGLQVGDYVFHSGCTDDTYNGIFVVTAVDDANTYEVDADWTATDTGYSHGVIGNAGTVGDGKLTITQSGCDIGDVDTLTPVMNSRVNTGGIVGVISDGGSTTAAEAIVTIVIDR